MELGAENDAVRQEAAPLTLGTQHAPGRQIRPIEECGWKAGM